MKRSIFIILTMVCFGLNAQSYEIGAFVGGVNNIGDVGRTSYLLPSGLAYGGMFKWNKSKRYSWRGSVLYGQFKADDSKSNMASRNQRGYVIDNSVLEFSAGLEFNFGDFNLHRLGPAFTPYLYTGFTYFRYRYNYFNGGIVQDFNQKDGALAIPMTLGFKVRLNQMLIFGAEVGARYTFTDNLDGSNPKGSNFEDFKFGNIFSDDWYVFSGVTITYTFGELPCGDCFE